MMHVIHLRYKNNISSFFGIEMGLDLLYYSFLREEYHLSPRSSTQLLHTAPAVETARRNSQPRGQQQREISYNCTS